MTERGPDQNRDDEAAEDEARRRLLKIMAYTAPAILTVLTVSSAQGAVFPSCPPGCSPNYCNPATCGPGPKDCNPFYCNPNGF